MITETLAVDPRHPDPRCIARAAEVLRQGGLVAFPTETVYGLGANALDPRAVARIFEAKGRPASNPVIVHVASPEEAARVAMDWPAAARALAQRFWPGPLTLVVPRRPELPDLIAAGGPTVGLRCPDHAVARALIAAAGTPIAAPSANRSTELSPTRAEHVLSGLAGRIEMVLDGGPCPGGIESTVVDVTGDLVRLLRPGLISAPMLEAVVGPLSRRSDPAGPARAPGQMERHYSPRTLLRLVDGPLLACAIEARAGGGKIGCILFTDSLPPDGTGASSVTLTSDPAHAATHLYDTLYRLDQEGLSLILVELPPDTPEWAAVRDRLRRAAADHPAV